jgi:hypothetical protein
LAVWKVPRQCPLVLLVKDLINFELKDVGAAVVGEMETLFTTSALDRGEQSFSPLRKQPSPSYDTNFMADGWPQSGSGNCDEKPFAGNRTPDSLVGKLLA